MQYDIVATYSDRLDPVHKEDASRKEMHVIVIEWMKSERAETIHVTARKEQG